MVKAPLTWPTTKLCGCPTLQRCNQSPGQQGACSMSTKGRESHKASDRNKTLRSTSSQGCLSHGIEPFWSIFQLFNDSCSDRRP